VTDTTGATTAPALPGVASSAVAPLLRGPRRPVRVLAVFRAAVYLAHDDGVLALVTSDGIAHPNGVVVTAATASVPFAGLGPHQRGTVGEGRVDLPGLTVPIGRWWDPRPRLAPVAAAPLRAAVETARRRLERAAITADPPRDARLAAIAAAVADALVERDVDAAVATARHLLGRGPGLTPAGDDVLAGLLAATVALAPAVDGGPRDGLVAATLATGATIADLARDATTAVSAALLHHAVRGEVATPAAEVLHALTGRRDLTAALTSLLAVGSSSGGDLAVGMLAGADLVLDPRAADTPVPTPPHDTPTDLRSL
jgi:hypothetical protein